LLRCHPATPPGGVRAVGVRVERRTDGRLCFRYRADGDMARVAIPEPQPPHQEQRLWEHTCFECFIAREVGSADHEFNFPPSSPSGAWAAHAFSGYRDGGPIDDVALAPTISVRGTAERLELDAVVSLDALSPAHPGSALCLAISAVIEARDGSRSYWALRHPG